MWKFPEESGSESYWRMSLEDGICKWERWTDQQEGEHFKAHDQRLFGVYRSEEQSYGEFLEKPFRDIKEEVFQEIAQILRRKTKEEMEESQRKKDGIVHYYWVPAKDKGGEE